MKHDIFARDIYARELVYLLEMSEEVKDQSITEIFL